MMNRIPHILLGWLFCAFMLVGLFHASHAQTTIYQETFDNQINGLPIGWSRTGVGWFPADSLPLISGPALSGCDALGSFYRYHSSGLTTGQSGTLISPLLNLSSYAGDQLNLDFCLNNPGVVIGEGDGIRLSFSKDGGVSWGIQATDTAYYGTWTTLSFPLADSFLTSSFRIRIEGVGTQALIDVGIDDLRITNQAPPCLADTSSVFGATPAFVCKDQFADQLSLSTSNTGGSSYQFILADAQDRLIQLIQGNIFDANFLLPDEYRIYGVSFDGALIAPVNIPVFSISATGCAILSGNFLEFRVVQLEGNVVVNSNYNGFAVSIAGNNDGAASVSLSGGGGTYSYVWQGDPGNNSPTSQQLGAGLQVVTVLDSLTGCSFSDTVFLQEPPVLTSVIEVQSDYNGAPISCTGESDGELVVTINGGVPPYQIVWVHDPLNDSLRALELPEDWYEISVSDMNGASATDSIFLAQPSPLQVNVETIKPACFGLQDGVIQVSQSGGTGEGSWEWDHGQLGSLVAGLRPETYRVLLTDLNGCTIQDSFLIEEAEQPIILPDVTHPSCFGAADAKISLEVLAGQGPFIHTWLSGDTGQVRSGLIPGVYQVLSTDGNGCKDTNQIRILSPSPLRTNVSTTPDGGSGTGEATISVEGGVAPFFAIWPSGDSSLTYQGLAAGQYQIPVEDANGCLALVPVEIELSETPDCLVADLGFSPNGDGINDVWEIPCIQSYQNLEIQVLNRWGQRVYYALDYTRPWDGRSRGADLPNGTYYYVIRLVNNGRPSQFKGTLSIVR